MSADGPEQVEVGGYALRWGDEWVAKGAITQEKLDEAVARGVPLTYNFQPDKVLGVVTAMRADNDGLMVSAKVSLDVSDEVMGGAVKFAIGGTVTRATVGPQEERLVDQFDLRTVSIVRERWRSALDDEG